MSLYHGIFLRCGRLLLRICHSDFWFCGILTDRLVSKIFCRDWLYERSRTFAWFSKKLQWLNKKTKFSIYSIWNIYSTSKTLPMLKNEILCVDYLKSIICWAKLEELEKAIPYHSEKYKECIITIFIYCSTRFIICNVVHSCCLFSYGKSFTPYDITIFDSADGRINLWKWNPQSNYLQNKRKVWIWLVNIFKWCNYFDK